MSGLLALLDDVAAIAKVAAASVDDIAGAAAKAGAKAAGVVIDDAAVTPKYVHGFEADRELPIIWRIARGSLKNKLVILLPVALALRGKFPKLRLIICADNDHQTPGNPGVRHAKAAARAVGGFVAVPQFVEVRS